MNYELKLIFKLHKAEKSCRFRWNFSVGSSLRVISVMLSHFAIWYIVITKYFSFLEDLRYISERGLHCENLDWSEFIIFIVYSSGPMHNNDQWSPAGSDIIMLRVLSGQGDRSEVRGLNRFVCVSMCMCVCVRVCLSVLLVVCLCLKDCVYVCGGLACLSSPLAVIRRDIGSMMPHNPLYHPLRERLYPFHPVMCVWLPVLGPWQYVRS